MAVDALTKLRSLAKALRKAGIGTYRLDEEKGILDVGGLELDEEFWTGIRIEIAHDGLFRAKFELDWDRDGDETVENVYDSIRSNLDKWIDDRTKLSWPTLDTDKKKWEITITRTCDDEAGAVEWVKWLLDWM